MNIAIIGSREGFTLDKVNKEMYLEFREGDNTLITGGARGVDTLALSVAKLNKIEYIIIRPDNPRIKQDYILRNFKIVDMSDKIIAFWDGESKGTKSVIDYARKTGKELRIIKNE